MNPHTRLSALLGILALALVALAYMFLFSGFRAASPVAVAPGAATSSQALGIYGPALVYNDTIYRFSLDYPSDYAVSRYPEAGGNATVVFQGPGAGEGFQIFITSYAGATITPDRFKEDIPSDVVDDPLQVVIGDDIQAVHFMSVAPEIGTSSETWFIENGHLYEVTAYAALDAEMAAILKTLHFEASN